MDADDVAFIKILKDAGVQTIDKRNIASFRSELSPTKQTFDQRSGSRLQQIRKVNKYGAL